MEKLKAFISLNIDKHLHFEEYFKIIDIVLENENSNPDICIESCKALIEGISKTILINLDKTKTIENIDDDNLPKLYKESMTLLSRECEDIEGDFVLRFASIINVLAEIRNKRGDISHGRMAPKPIFSSYKLAGTISNMTASFLTYILEHYFTLDLNPIGKLIFGSDKMQSYNEWLDESVVFPITKARYSQLLYENDYDEYESRYTDEYLKSLEPDDEKIDISIVESPDIPIGDLEMQTKAPETFEIKKDRSDEMYKRYFGEKEEKPKPVEELINSFDESAFWIEERREKMNVFAAKENLVPNSLKILLDNYMFTNKRPFRDQVAECLNEKPSLKERGKTTEELTDKIIEFAQELNILTDKV